MTLASSSLAGYFQPIIDHLSPSWVDESMRARLWASANILPAILRGGFELRLAPTASQVDLHVNIVNPREREQVRAHLDALSPSQPAWDRLRAFIGEWAAPGNWLHQSILSAWLECDSVSDSSLAGNASPAPSVFAGPEVRYISHERLADALMASLDLLLPERTAAVRALQNRCREAVFAHGGYISHIGAMLGRSTDAVRFNVNWLKQESVHPFLQSLGWQGDAEQLDDVLAWAYPLVDEVVVCVDVDEQVYPQVGLELFVAKGTNTAARWTPVLDALIERGLCAPAKRDPLLAWQGLLPLPRAEGQPVNVLACKIHHFKLTVTTGGESAKGYLFFFGQQLVAP